MDSDFSAYDHSLGQLWEDYRTNPHNAELLHALCFALNVRGQHRECAALARQGLGQNPEHYNLYYELLVATSLVAGEELSVIGPEIETMFADRPGSLGAKRNLALYYFYMENDADAAALLNEILTQFDTDQVDLFTYELLAQLEHANGHFQEGIDICDRGLAKQGPGARLARLKGLCHLDLGQVDAALACFEQALEMEPHFIWACHSLGSLYFERGDYRNAFAYFGRAVAINPADSNHYFLLAEAFMDQGAFRLAAAELEKLIWSKPPANVLPEAHNALGYLWTQAQHWRRAEDHLRYALELAPELVPAHYNLGLLFQKQSQHQQARYHYDHALELDDQHLESWLALGMLHLDSDDGDEAEVCFQTALDLDPEVALAYVGLSRLAELRALPENQLMYARTAVQLDPEDPDAQTQMIRAFAANQLWVEGLNAVREWLEAGVDEPRWLDAVLHLLAAVAEGSNKTARTAQPQAILLVEDSLARYDFGTQQRQAFETLLAQLRAKTP